MKQSETLTEGVHRQTAVQWCLVLFISILTYSSGLSATFIEAPFQSTLQSTTFGDDYLDPGDGVASESISIGDLLASNGTLANTREVSGSVNLDGYSMRLNEAGEPVFVQGDANDHWDLEVDVFPLNSTSIYAMAIVGDDLFIGGNFDQVDDIVANNIVRYNILSGTWHKLGAGLNGNVTELYVYNDQLFIGGRFSSANGLPANNIVRYDITSASWNLLGEGVSGSIYAILAKDNVLYVGGIFQRAGNQLVDNIARYDLNTDAGNISWSSFSNGGVRGRYTGSGDYTSSTVYSLILHETNLYIAGTFAYAGDTGANLLARYDLITDTWHNLSTSFTNERKAIYAMARKGNDLIVGGTFIYVSGIRVNKIARFDLEEETWHAMGEGITGIVRSLTIPGNTVYVGGFIHTVDGVDANNIARFDLISDSWSLLGDGVNEDVRSIQLYGDDIFVGGFFSSAGFKPASKLARWNDVLLPLPNKMRPVAPENDSDNLDLRPEISWLPAHDAVTYELQVSENPDLSDFVLDVTEINTTSYNITSGLLNSTTYYWRVRGVNVTGNGEWSDVQNFSTFLTLPGQVDLFSPLDEGENVSIEPKLTWQSETGADTYRLVISENSDLSDPLFTESEISSNSFQLESELDYLQTYYWRVRATNELGNGAWSESWSFMTAAPVPEQVSLQSPSHQMSDVQLRPELTWQATEHAASYDLQVSADNSFSDLVVEEAELNDNSFMLDSNLDYQTSYYWRVRAVNGSGVGEWSDVWQFTTLIEPPERVDLESPANNSSTIDLTPFLRWQEATGAESYDLQLANETTFSEPLINLSGHTSDSYQIPVDLSYSTTYYWRVRAENSTDDSEWSDIWSFTTLMAPPPPVTISYPLNSVDNVDLLPELSWETGAGADSYDLRVSERMDLTDPVIDETGLTENSYQSSDELEFNRTYFWQVRGVNATGPGEWSEVVSFKTISPDAFALDQNYPNPFSKNGSGTTIRFRIPEDGRVRMYLHDSTGRRAATIVDEEMIAGEHERTFYGRNLAPTVYYYTLIFNQQQTTKTLIIIN